MCRASEAKSRPSPHPLSEHTLLEVKWLYCLLSTIKIKSSLPCRYHHRPLLFPLAAHGFVCSRITVRCSPLSTSSTHVDGNRAKDKRATPATSLLVHRRLVVARISRSLLFRPIQQQAIGLAPAAVSGVAFYFYLFSSSSSSSPEHCLPSSTSLAAPAGAETRLPLRLQATRRRAAARHRRTPGNRPRSR